MGLVPRECVRMCAGMSQITFLPPLRPTDVLFNWGNFFLPLSWHHRVLWWERGELGQSRRATDCQEGGHCVWQAAAPGVTSSLSPPAPTLTSKQWGCLQAVSSEHKQGGASRRAPLRPHGDADKSWKALVVLLSWRFIFLVLIALFTVLRQWRRSSVCFSFQWLWEITNQSFIVTRTWSGLLMAA